jgi:hypothetical protein
MSTDDDERALLRSAPPPPRLPNPGEPLFEFIRASDGRRTFPHATRLLAIGTPLADVS